MAGRPRLAIRSVLTLVLGTGLMATASGCGNCDGAIRELLIRSTEACGLDECVEEGGRFTVGPDLSVRVVGDGPNEGSDVLLGESGVSEDTFFLLDEAGQRVAVTLGADAGGHSCRNGVGFGLEPEQPLPAGAYAVVLVLDELAWPLVGGAEVQSHDGQEAFVRNIEVVEGS